MLRMINELKAGQGVVVGLGLDEGEELTVGRFKELARASRKEMGPLVWRSKLAGVNSPLGVW